MINIDEAVAEAKRSAGSVIISLKPLTVAAIGYT